MSVSHYFCWAKMHHCTAVTDQMGKWPLSSFTPIKDPHIKYKMHNTALNYPVNVNMLPLSNIIMTF